MAIEDEVKKGRLISLTMTFEYAHIIENGKAKTKTITIGRDEALKIGAVILDKTIYQKIRNGGYVQNAQTLNATDAVLTAFTENSDLASSLGGDENAMVLLYTEPVDGEEVYASCNGDHKTDWVE